MNGGEAMKAAEIALRPAGGQGSDFADQRHPGDAGRGIAGAAGGTETGGDGRCAGAISLDALQGTDVAFDERIHRRAPTPDRSLVAGHLRTMLEGSDAARAPSRLQTRCRTPTPCAAFRRYTARCAMCWTMRGRCLKSR